MSQIPISKFSSFKLLQELRMMAVQLWNVEENTIDFFFGYDWLRTAQRYCQSLAVL